ncbi:hypothetical protein K9N68_07060 [Kovacikia minuta CCNUW1]|uniref:hypothetical protein n=1 Tax=Kovacikia minuta TaxID=2931930 RepID=UPI001CCC4E68|nr:hypothetical protein [Kovacikia minuta]UBF27671.1 hypothetical protein K9N68_07060 [Kovacikia minuta CCNUW1]
MWNFAQINRWLDQASLGALEDAYQGSVAIKAIEDTHFGGGPITPQVEQGKAVGDYFRTQLDRHLLGVRSSLLRFKMTSFLVNRQMVNPPIDSTDRLSAQDQNLPAIASEAKILEKLAFIESVVGKYRIFDDLIGSSPAPTVDRQPAITPEVVLETNSLDVAAEATHSLAEQSSDATPVLRNADPPNVIPAKATPAKFKPVRASTSKSNAIPASARLFGGASQIGKEFSSKYEREMIQELRIRRAQNWAAIRWLAVLLMVPILVQIATKHLILDPILGSYSDRNPTKIELSKGIQDKFLHEFSEYKEALEVKALLVKSLAEEEKKRQEEKPTEQVKPEGETALAKAVYGTTPVEQMLDTLSLQPGSYMGLLTAAAEAPEVEAALEQKALEEKALELWREARDEQLDGLKNVLADGAGLLAFVAMVYFGRQRLISIKGFSNRAFLSLNDPTKVFLFILITDMFVGFHSVEGWEVILGGILEHFGLPESKVFINSFIATIPVIIDSCVKFWIFSYLTRFSPSASAIYERMNT